MFKTADRISEEIADIEKRLSLLEAEKQKLTLSLNELRQLQKTQIPQNTVAPVSLDPITPGRIKLFLIPVNE